MLENKLYAHTAFKRVCLFAVLVPLAAAIVSTCILSPVYTQVAADILYSNTMLPDVLGLAISLFDVIFAAAQYTAIAISVILFRKAAYRRAVLLISFGEIAVERALNLAVSVITNNSGTSSGLNVTLVYFALEAFQLGICVLIVRFVCREATKKYVMLCVAARRLGDLEFNWISEIYPYRALHRVKNPIVKCGWIVGVIFAALKVMSRFIYDLSYGAPSGWNEVAQMIAGYLSDILCGVFIFLFVLLFATYFFKWLAKNPEQQVIAGE